MSETGENEAKYKIRKDTTGEVSKNSRDYSGKGTATYFNGDTYTGAYKDGVILFEFITYTFLVKKWKRCL